MAEYNEFDLDKLDGEIDRENKVEKRIKDLSEKVKLTAEDRDEKQRLYEEQRVENETLRKERDFLNSFGDQVAKFSEAANFRDQIKERVLKGYTVEDATAAVLVAQGKYVAPTVPPQPTITPEAYAGGSSATLQASGDKPLSEMTREEKRAMLLQAENRSDIH